jgi:hypothetical protein
MQGKLMKQPRLMVVSVAIGGLALAAALVLAPIHDACAQADER